MIKVVAALMCVVATAPMIATSIAFFIEFFQRRMLGYWIIVSGLIIAAVTSAAMAIIVSDPMLLPQDASRVELYRWLHIEGPPEFDVAIAVRTDSYAAIVVLMITTIASVILIHDKQQREQRPLFYFPSLGLAISAAVLVVLSSNFVMLLIAWSLTTVAATLIQTRATNTERSPTKSNLFLSLVVADIGVLLAVAFVWLSFGTLEMSEILSNVSIQRVIAERPAVVGTICFFLFVGVIGRTAQFPLFVWLHDLDDKPASSAAIIQTVALMPTGIYLILRCHLLFESARQIRSVIAMVCGLSMFLLAFIANGQDKVSRVFGLSSAIVLAQAILAVCVASQPVIEAALIVLVVHSITKCVLFLSADNMGWNRDDVSIDKPSIEFAKSRWAILTAILVLVSGVAGSGTIVSSLSEVPAVAAENTNMANTTSGQTAENADINADVMYGVVTLMYLTIFMHAFALMRIFLIALRNNVETTVDKPSTGLTRWLPMYVLLALAIGFFVISFTGMFHDALLRSFWPAKKGTDTEIVQSIFDVGLLAASGMVSAWLHYAKPSVWPQRIAGLAGPFSRLSKHGLYAEEFYRSIFADLIRNIATFCGAIDRLLFRGLLSTLSNNVAKRVATFGDSLHTGNVQLYVLTLILTMAALTITLLWNAG